MKGGDGGSAAPWGRVEGGGPGLRLNEVMTLTGALICILVPLWCMEGFDFKSCRLYKHGLAYIHIRSVREKRVKEGRP